MWRHTDEHEWSFCGRTRWVRVVSIGLVIASISVTALSFTTPAGASTAPKFIWTGTAAMSKPHDFDWSDGANWQGGVAPVSPGPVDLVFGPLVCKPVSKCYKAYTSTNNLTGLTVGMLSFALQKEAGSPPPAYYISGNPIILDGMTEKSTAKESIHLGVPNITLPITLGQDETWSFNGGQIAFTGKVSGSYSLTVSVGNLAFADFDDSQDSVGAVDVVGKKPLSGIQASNNGALTVGSGDSLNAGGNSITLTDADLYDPGGTTGPVNTGSGSVDAGSESVPYYKFKVDGALTLDNSTYFSFYNLTPGTSTPPSPVAGTDYPQEVVKGPMAIASGQLEVEADCNQPLGTVYELITASAGISGTFTEAPDFGSGSGTISNGDVIQANMAEDGSCDSSGSTPPYLEFNYDDSAGAFTATVVAAPDAMRQPDPIGQRQPSWSQASRTICRVVGFEIETCAR
jgi:hypothetical protein